MKLTDEKIAARQPKASEKAAKHRRTLKSRLLKVIGAAEANETASVLDQIWSTGKFHVQSAPRCGMVMVSVRDCFDLPFHLGEVLVSEAEVVSKGHRGHGMICGDEPEQALILAAAEAAESAGQHLALECIGDFVGHLEAKMARQIAASAKLVAATRVQFGSMKEESVDFGSLGEES